MFLSRLNEISGGCEKIVPVSESFWSNLKFFKNDRFNCVVVKVKFESEWNAVIQIHFRFTSDSKVEMDSQEGQFTSLVFSSKNVATISTNLNSIVTPNFPMTWTSEKLYRLS